MSTKSNCSNKEDDSTHITNENDDYYIELKTLQKNLLNFECISAKIDNNYLMESENENKSKSGNTVSDTYFENNEEICEVKYNLFLILSKDCRLDPNNYSKFLYPSQKGSKELKEVKVQRFVSQEFTINEKKVNFEDKKYIFIPRLQTSKNIEFLFNKDKIFCDSETMKYNGEKLDDEKTFIKKHRNEIDFNNLNDLQVNEIIKEIESEESMKIEEHKESESSQHSKSKEKSKKSKKSFLSKLAFSKTDQSEKEIYGERFFKEIDKNNYIRFLTTHYTKEIDGIYSHHEIINLKTSEKVQLIDGINKLETEYKNDNDLKCHIIYKNFDSDIIKKDEPIILEIKNGFNLIDLLIQMKQNSKIFNNYYEKDNDNLNLTKKLNLPKTAIGIICTDRGGHYKDQINTLTKEDGNYSLLKHINQVIENNNFNVVIGVIKDSKINDYILNKPDFNDENNKISKRVDIWYLNKQTKIDKSKEEVDKIFDDYKDIYNSLSFIKQISIEILFEQDNKRLKELEDAEIQYKNELSEKEGTINQYKKVLSEKEGDINQYKKVLSEKEDEIQNYQEQLKESEKDKSLFELFKKSNAYKEFMKTKEYQDFIAENKNNK